MKNNVLTQSVSVSPQIGATDVAAIASAGFKTILCNRPDGEETGQPEFEEISEAARQQGIEAIYQPVSGKAMTQKDVTDFGIVIAACPQPVFAYCRTGTRCANLWAFSEATKGTSTEKIVQAGNSAGYNLGKLFE